MKTFSDLAFAKDHNGNEHAYMTFDNGYGVSVIRGPTSYGGDKGLYELAILLDDEICYNTDITDDVLGHLSKAEVTEAMQKVQELGGQAMKRRKRTYIITVYENNEAMMITEDEINKLELNLEHGYDVDSVIEEALKKRKDLC